jgi:DNA-directed RNA polymerase subunit RPC12/RpoP
MPKVHFDRLRFHCHKCGAPLVGSLINWPALGQPAYRIQCHDCGGYRDYALDDKCHGKFDLIAVENKGQIACRECGRQLTHE